MNDHKKGRKELGIPPRWLYCPRKGSPIVGKYMIIIFFLQSYFNAE